MINKLVKYETELKIVQNSIKKLNKQFSLCDVLVLYHGDNRNLSAIKKDVVEANLYSLYGVPIVGEWVYKVEGKDEKTWGSHGGKIIIDDNGIHFEETTKPFGFVTEEAVKNASWITVTEKDGHTQHEYLKLSGCILWTERYEESKSILDYNFGQSMEIEIIKGHYRNDNYFEVEEFVFSALCILGTEVEPCFESANITRHYEYDEFKKEYKLMLDEYKNFTKSTSDKDDDIKNKKKKGEFSMKLDLNKVTSLLSTFKFNDQSGNEVEKYALLGVGDETIVVLDKEDNFRLFAVTYALDEAEELIVDFDSKVEHVFSTLPKEETDGVDKNVIVDIFMNMAEKLSDEKIEVISKELEANYTQEIKNVTDAYEELSKSFAIANERLEEYNKIEEDKKIQEHRDNVAEIVEKYAVKLKNYSAFLIFRAKLKPDEVDLVDLEKELSLMAGKALMDGANKKDSFSYTPNETNIKNFNKSNSASSNRYGSLLDKYKIK